MKECIFCKIVNEEIPVHKVFEDDDYLVFHDAFPTMKGQLLVIPKKHYSYLFEMPDDEYCNLWLTAKRAAKAMDMSVAIERVAVVVEGLEVDHVHIRLYPIDKKGISFKKIEMSDSEMKDVADRIRKELS